MPPRQKGEKGGSDMLLSLLLPFGVGIITRLSLRTRGQQRQPLTIDAPWWALIGGWVFAFLGALLGLAGPTNGDLSLAIALIAVAGAVGLLTPELGAATSSGLSKPKSWLWLLGIGVVLYGLFIDSQILEGGFILLMMVLAYRVIMGWIKPSKKKGG